MAAEQAALRVLAGHAGVREEDFETRVPRGVAEGRAHRTLALSEARRTFWNMLAMKSIEKRERIGP